MKIYFCDLCNESIPLKDINSNRISIEDGKIICPKCAPKALRKRNSLPGGLMAFIGVTFAGLVVLAFLGASVTDDLARDLGALRDDHGDLKKVVGGQGRTQNDMASRLVRAEGALAELRGDVETRQIGRAHV